MWTRVWTRVFGPIAAAAALSAAAGVAVQAAEEALHPEKHEWTFEGPFGTFDREQLQRGYQVYRQVCAACHGMKYISFRNLGEPGGPFYDEDFPNPADNPVVRALAAEVMVTDGPNEFGESFMREGRPADMFPSPYANETQARFVNNGAYPPDLSVITRARHDGVNYLHALMLGYNETPPADKDIRPGLYYNPWFPGAAIAMPPQLFDGRIDYAEGQPAATEAQMAEDVTAFLAWAADPHQESRKRMGFITIIYLTIFAVLLWFSYKQIWRNVKH